MAWRSTCGQGLVLVLRTFSKIYGLAGLRVGYGVGPTDVITAIGKTRRAFDVSTQAQVAALASLNADAELAERRLTHEGRQLERTLREHGLATAGPAVANFVFTEVGEDATPLFEALLRQGAIVRPLGVRRPDTSGSLGTPDENRSSPPRSPPCLPRRVVLPSSRSAILGTAAGALHARVFRMRTTLKRGSAAVPPWRATGGRAPARRAVPDHGLPPARALEGPAGGLPHRPRLDVRLAARGRHSAAGGAYLWFHQSVAAVVASTPDVKVASAARHRAPGRAGQRSWSVTTSAPAC